MVKRRRLEVGIKGLFYFILFYSIILAHLPRNRIASPPPQQHDMDSAGYPATTKKTAGLVKGIHTDVTVVGLADKLFITITQDGRLAQWVQTLDRKSVV